MNADSLGRIEPRRQEQVRQMALRKPQRVSITLPWKLYELLLSISDRQGRSLSNLACYWLERQAELHAQTDRS
jgi:CopG-like RHH_1 or ribbon-helix-helix domain, RHH_5